MSAWIEDTLGGIFVLQGFGPRHGAIVQAAIARYRGGDFGGLDMMAPNAADEAWLLVGRWADCWVPEVQASIAAFHAALAQVVELDRHGVELGTGGAVTIETSRAFPDSARGELRVQRAYLGRIAAPPPAETLYPQLPGYLGLHMGAPHWFGRGVARDGQSIRSVTPYLRLDVHPGRGVQISGMAEPRDFDPWLAALRAATGWP